MKLDFISKSDTMNKELNFYKFMITGYMDTNKLTELTDSLKHYKNQIRIKTDELNSPYEYTKYSQPIEDLNFSIYGLDIKLDDVESIRIRDIAPTL